MGRDAFRRPTAGAGRRTPPAGAVLGGTGNASRNGGEGDAPAAGHHGDIDSDPLFIQIIPLICSAAQAKPFEELQEHVELAERGQNNL